MKTVITEHGLSLMLRAMTGSADITFTKIKFGNGEEQPATATDLGNPIIELPISTMTREENYILLTASCLNANVPTEFSAHEIGVFAQHPDDPTTDVLYCLWYEEDPVKADYISPTDDRILGTNIELRVYVHTAENVSAVIPESGSTVDSTTLSAHINNFSNPHKVTKTDVGLGNVPNVTPENQTPVFSEKIGPITVTSETNNTTGEVAYTTSMANIANGDTMGTILQKIRTAISGLLSHLNGKNPHNITPKAIGAAGSTHYHNANEIRTGTLGISRGGTGGATAAAARRNLGIVSGQATVTITAGSEALIEYTYPVAFKDSIPIVVATPTVNAISEVFVGIRETTTEGFTATVYSGLYTGDVTINWIAIQ